VAASKSCRTIAPPTSGKTSAWTIEQVVEDMFFTGITQRLVPNGDSLRESTKVQSKMF